MIVRIERRPLGLCVHVPAAIAQAAGLRPFMKVRLTVDRGRISVEPLPGPSLTLAERLALFDPVAHGGEVMGATPPAP